MRITVTGIGYVGLVTAVYLADLGHEVTCIDLNKSKIDSLQTGHSPIHEPDFGPLLVKNISYSRLFFTTNPKTAYREADIIFITVGTPAKKDGTMNLRYITAITDTIAQQITNDIIICTKSTVPVGTNEKIKQMIDSQKAGPFITTVISNPEFLREGSAIFVFFHGDRIVIGSDNSEASETMEKLYAPLHIPIIIFLSAGHSIYLKQLMPLPNHFI